MNRLMMVLLLAGFWAVPVYAEEMTYYVWTDDQGVTHASDSPPKNRAYETRAVGYDAGTGSDTVSPPDDETTSSSTETETTATLEEENESESRIVRGGDDSGLGKAIIMKRALPGEPGLGDVPNVPGVPDVGVTGTVGP